MSKCNIPISETNLKLERVSRHCFDPYQLAKDQPLKQMVEERGYRESKQVQDGLVWTMNARTGEARKIGKKRRNLVLFQRQFGRRTKHKNAGAQAF
jgi:hypothetical protein